MPRHPLFASLCLAAGLALMTACGSSEGHGPGGNRGAGPRGVAGGAQEGPLAATEELIPVDVATVERRRMTDRYSTSATLRPSRRATVTTRTSGVLEALYKEEGDRVGGGEPLARLESSEQRIARNRTESTLETRRREFERLQSLHEQGLVSDDALEQARREYRDAEHAAELAELELSRTVIRAPFAGVVLHRHLDVGNTVSQGTAVYDLADVTPLHAEVEVPERHLAELTVGQPVELAADAGDQRVEAAIERIAPAVNPDTGTVTVTVAVEPTATLRPGTFVRVDFVTDVREDTLVVPRAAIVAEGNRRYVYRVDDGTASKLAVDLGYESGDDVEIIDVEGGAALEAGDRVVTAGAGALSDQARVEAVSTGDDTGAAAPSGAG